MQRLLNVSSSFENMLSLLRIYITWLLIELASLSCSTIFSIVDLLFYCCYMPKYSSYIFTTNLHIRFVDLKQILLFGYVCFMTLTILWYRRRRMVSNLIIKKIRCKLKNAILSLFCTLLNSSFKLTYINWEDEHYFWLNCSTKRLR